MNFFQLGELLAKINEGVDLQYPQGILYPLAPTPFKVDTNVKLQAIQCVMQWLYSTDDSHPIPPTLKKTRNPLPGLRSQAKKAYQSQVGEIYNCHHLLELAQLNGFDSSQIFTAANAEDFCQLIIGELIQGHAPIIFFDMDFETQNPGSFGGQQEQAAIVFGYFFDKNKQLFFLVNSLQNYFLCPADRLARSAAQLSEERVEETFYKIEKRWISTQSYFQHKLDSYPKRVAIGNRDKTNSFRNKIIRISAKKAVLQRGFILKSINNLLANTLENTSVFIDNNYQLAPLDPSAYLPLSHFINYFLLEILRPKSEREASGNLTKLIDSNELNATISSYMTSDSPPYIDESFISEIKNQFKLKSRSFIEEVSNSIDANAKEIHSTLRDGFYEIREIDGKGMTPEILCLQYLIPKESTKSNSSKKIGRFGIGAFTKLNHLLNEQHYVIVETRAEGCSGYRLEFRLIHGKFHLALTMSNTISYGTTTKVFSSDIKHATYANYIGETLNNTHIPIYLNGKLLQPAKTKCKSVKTIISGIVIHKIKHEQEHFVTNVSWKFPDDTRYTESRDNILVDSDEIRQFIRDQISLLNQLEDPKWVKYANSITPLIIELQNHNSSLLNADNLLNYLQQTLVKKLEKKRYIPDKEIYRMLAVDDVVRLHPAILPNDWIDRIGRLAPDWDPQQGTKVILVDSVFTATDEPFIFDKDINHLFLDKHCYQVLKNNNALEGFTNALKHPLGEIDLHYNPMILKNNPEEAVVYFNDELLENPRHSFYLTHGIFSLYSAELTKFTEQQLKIIASAKSIMKIQPLPSNCDISGAAHRVRYNNQLFYFFPDNSHNRLFNENYHPLNQEKWFFLQKKLNQIVKKKTVEEEVFVTLDKTDLFPIYNWSDNTHFLYNGLGEIVRILSPDCLISTKKVGEELHIFYESDKNNSSLTKIYLYDAKSNLSYPLSRNSWKLSLEDNSLLLGYEYNSDSNWDTSVEIFDLKTLQLILPTTTTIVFNQGHFLALSNGKLIFADRKAEILFAQPSLINPFKHFLINALTNDLIQLSILSHSNDVVFLQAVKHDNQWQVEIYRHTLGYPVQFIATQEKNTLVITRLSDQKQLKGTVDEFKFLTVCQNNQALNLLHNSMFFIGKKNQQLFYFNQGQFCFYPLNLNWNIADISIVDVKKETYIQLSRIDGNTRIYILLTKQGEVLLQGEMQHFASINNNDFLLNDSSLYQLNPLKKITEHNFSSISTGFFQQKPILFGRNIAYQFLIFAETGELLHSDLRNINALAENPHFLQLVHNSGKKRLFTPYNSIPYNEMKALYNTSTFSHDRLIIALSCNDKTQLLLASGYKFFNDLVADNPELIAPNKLFLRKSNKFEHSAILEPLQIEKLLDPHLLNNLAMLNQLNLSVYHYSLCLRFIHWATSVLQAIVPVIPWLIYTPGIEKSADYLAIARFCKDFSKPNQETIIKTFDLIHAIRHDHLEEPIADKLITVIKLYGLNPVEELYRQMGKIVAKFSVGVTDFSHYRILIDQMPTFTAQLCYYLLFPDHLLLEKREKILNFPKVFAQSISLLDFMCAYQFQPSIMDFLPQAPSNFVYAIKHWGNYCEQQHFLRVLQHAIYHQADPHHHLYQRELLQNALDANTAINANPPISIHLFNENNHCVFSIRDEGIGMTLEQVFTFFCLAGFSSKRHAVAKNYIGQHGIGIYTAFYDAACLRVKTSQTASEHYCFEFRPLYDADDKIIDVEVNWTIVQEPFQGTLVERVARKAQAALDASRHFRTVKYHAQSIDANEVVITLNGEVINRPLPLLAKLDCESLGGKISLYRSIDDVITSNRLVVKPIDNLDHFIPAEIRNTVRKGGIIIALPPLALNRERCDFIETDKIEYELKRYLFNLYIHAYIHILQANFNLLSELPYDFFEYFERFLQRSLLDDAELEQDIIHLNNNEILSNYTKYHSLLKLHQLLAFLPLFPMKGTGEKDPQGRKQKKYSLYQLAQYYQEHRKIPDLENTPFFLINLIHHHEMNQQLIEWQKKSNKELEKYVNLYWIPDQKKLSVEWQALFAISKHISSCLGHELHFALSTATDGSLLSTTRNSFLIYWNIYSISFETSPVYSLFDSLRKNKDHEARQSLLPIIESIAHEVTHARLEETHSHTHNRSFFIKQRKILVNFYRENNFQQFFNEIKAKYQAYNCDNVLRFFSTKKLLKEQMAEERVKQQLNKFFSAQQEPTTLDENPNKLNNTCK